MTTLCEMLCLGDPKDDTGDRVIRLVLAGHVPRQDELLVAAHFPLVPGQPSKHVLIVKLNQSCFRCS